MPRGETHGQTQARGEATTLSGTAGQLRSTLVPGYKAMLSSGYSPEEKAGIRLSTMGPLSGTFDRMREAATNRVERTRNAAGFGELEDELARSQGRQEAELGGELEKSFADEAERRRETGLTGLSRMYGIDEDTMAKLLGVAGQPKGSSGLLGSGIGAGGSIGAALIAGSAW